MTTPRLDGAALCHAVHTASSADDLQSAVEALVASRDPQAIPCLIAVLGYNNPGAAVAAVDGLVALGAPAVDPILASLDGVNYGARAWSVRALAGLADVRALDLLEQALAGDIGPSVRRAAARGLGCLDLHGLSPEQRQTVLERCTTALLAACSDGEWVVRYAVVAALETLFMQNAAAWSELLALREALLAALQSLRQGPAADGEVIRRRAALALERVLPAPA